MSSTMAISGVISGMDTDSIMTKLESLERQSITRLQTQKTTLTAKTTAWNNANTRLLAVKTAASALANLATATLTSATSSDSSITATATAGAVTGDYTFAVDTVATYHQLTSQTFTATDTALGDGTFTLSAVGKSVAIDTTGGMTLAGLRDAINAQSDVGVKALIVSDGASTPQYRLLLTAQTIGEDGAITANSTIIGGPTMTELQAAHNTVLRFGSGDTAFTVERSGLSISDVIPGVTLGVTAASAGKTTTIHVATDFSTVKSNLNTLITQYNNLLDFVGQQNTYNSDAKTTGTLFGEYALQRALSDVSSGLMTPVSGLSSTLNSLSQLGITTDLSGHLSLDTKTFETATAANPDSVTRLFTAAGTSSGSHLSYVTATASTQPNGSAGYAVNITQAATQTRLTLPTALPDATTNAETLTINLTHVQITAGMTAAQVVEAINNAGASATASLTGADGTGTGNFLTLTTKTYGATGHVSVVSANPSGSLSIGTSTISDTAPGSGVAVAGLNIAGTINGAAATGAGRVLTSSEGPATGLAVMMDSDATGDVGTMVFTRGIGARVNDVLSALTDSVSGTIKSQLDSITAQQDVLDDAITGEDERVTRAMERMRTQFNSMETALGKLQNQAAQLSSLLSSMSTSSSSSSSSSS
jgi:flagellar hook-associated protein 2